MQDFEKLGIFYLGRGFDVEKRTPLSDLLLYDARDLTTHGVIVGMTGSGKTGLGVALLEEAAIDAIPSIVIDPKGDLTNLLLTFPQLRPGDFRPFVDPDEATRQGLSVEQLADKTAATWQKGLADWGQDGARVQRFRDAAEVTIYTPGSSAGLPLSVLRSFDVPPPAVMADPEALRDRIAGIASGLLALVDIEADPLRSREHILVSSILQAAFTEGTSLDLAGLIQRVQKPPFDRVGVLDLESFFPSADRFALAMALNNLIASPGFSAWTEGEPLDIARLLHTPQGKPRVSVLSIAHLSDPQRMFFVSILLNEVIGWMRAQHGTSSLRAVLYMDEIAGYFPPTAMPPSKRPMLTLLKQARAFGLGVVLATQNPVDLDYKGLSNCGTWFIGRLQTERDKARLLDGLEGAAAGAGRGFDRAQMDRILSGLGSRVFLMNNVHEDAPVTFQSRFALSFLRGPLTRDQIRALMDPRRGAAANAATRGAPTASAPQAPAAATAGTGAGGGGDRPVLPPEVSEFFLAPRAGRSGEGMVYRPAVFGSSRLHFVNAKASLDLWETHALLAPLGDDAEVDWSQATAFEDDAVPQLDKEPLAGARFGALPGPAARKQSYEAWRKSFTANLYQEKSITILRCAALKALSRPGESEGDFRVRISQTAKEARDGEVDKLRKKYAPKIAALEEKKRRAEEKVERQEAEYKQQGLDTALSVGTTILGALFGRKVASVGNLGRARTAARSASRAVKERSDVASAEEDVAAIDQQIADLTAQVDEELKKVEGAIDPATLALETIEVRPRKGDITIGTVALVWCPWRDTGAMAEPAY